MKNKKAILIVLVVLVVLLASVLVGMLTSRQSDVEEPASPTSKPTTTTPVNTSMDDVVAGTGATATSTTPGFEGVGTRYPATCVGAIQAAAEWSQKVFQNTERREAMLSNDQQGIRSFVNEISIAPGALDIFGSQATVGEGTFHTMLYGTGVDDVVPVASPRVQDGVIQVIKCAPDKDKTAVITVISPLDDTEHVQGLPNRFYGWLNRTYQLQVVDGTWRLVHIIDARDQTIYQQLLQPPTFKESPEQAAELLKRPATDGGRDIIGQLTLNGQGVHYFQNKNGQWGVAS